MKICYSKDEKQKRCTRCAAWKNVDEFWPSKLSTGKTHTRSGSLIRKGECKKCTNKLNKKWLTSDRQRNIDLKKKYNISLSQFEIQLEKQNGCCAICGSNQPGGKGSFHVDHDHKSGLIRGILCHLCNVGLGCFKDDILLLKKASRYVANITKFMSQG